MKKLIIILSLGLISCNLKKGIPIISSVKYANNIKVGKYYDEITIGSKSVSFWTDSLYTVGDTLIVKK